MTPVKLSQTLLVLVLVGCEANDARSAVPMATTQPACMKRKGGPPTTLPAEAKAVMDEFVMAVDEKKWDKALILCTPQTQSRASQYGEEEYFRRCVPMAKLKAERTFRFWTYTKHNEEYRRFGCFLNLSKTPDGREINWEWWLAHTAHGWKVDLPGVPVERWIQDEVDRLKRDKERGEARWRALEPKLEGLRTQLTALQREYRLGRPMPFLLELINEGEHELSYDDQQVAVNESMIIKDENGKVMPYTAGSFQTEGAPAPIKPGTSVVLFESLDIARQYDMKKAGKYRVQFSGRGLDVFDAIGSKNGAARREFPSNTVEIELKP